MEGYCKITWDGPVHLPVWLPPLRSGSQLQCRHFQPGLLRGLRATNFKNTNGVKASWSAISFQFTKGKKDFDFKLKRCHNTIRLKLLKCGQAILFDAPNKAYHMKATFRQLGNFCSTLDMQPYNQDCGTGAQAILDGWSRSPKLFRWWSWSQGRIQKGPIGAIASLKPTKVTFFSMIFYNSANSIRDLRPLRRPLFRHNSAVKQTSSL